MTYVIVVEDSADLRDSVVIFLQRAGFEAHGVADADELSKALRERIPDVVVLDVNLPGENGFSIASRLRTETDVGVIILSARDGVDDQIVGLTSGADVYLTKPVDMRVLSASVQSLALRRARSAADVIPQDRKGEWRLDMMNWLLIAPNGVSVDLSGNEQKLMSLFVDSRGETVGRELIFDCFGKTGGESDYHNLNAMLTRLRRKVEAVAGVELPLKSIRANGYAFTAPLGIDGPQVYRTLPKAHG